MEKANKKFSLHKRIKSFKYAFQGIFTLLKEEHNSRIHLFFAIMVVFGGFYFGITQTEWLIVILTISMVFAMEFINSAIEAIADKVSPENNPLIKKAKDLAAGAVLFTAIMSIIVGLIIFGEKVLKMFF